MGHLEEVRNMGHPAGAWLLGVGLVNKTPSWSCVAPGGGLQNETLSWKPWRLLGEVLELGHPAGARLLGVGLET